MYLTVLVIANVIFIANDSCLFLYGYYSLYVCSCVYLLLIIIYRKLADYRRDGTFPWARPDSKTQVKQLNIIHVHVYKCTQYCAHINYTSSLGMCTDVLPVKIHYIN